MTRLTDLRTLWDVARQYQALADAIDILQPQKWLENDPARLRTLVERITDARLAQLHLLHDRKMDAVLRRLADGNEPPPPSGYDIPLIREMRRICAAIMPLGENDIRAMEQATHESEGKWLESYETAEAHGKKAAFAEQSKPLEQVFGLRRALSRKIAAAAGGAPSEVPLDEWNPHMKNADIDSLFADAAAVWPALMDALHLDAAARPAPLDPFAADPLLGGTFSAEKQLAFFRDVQQAMLSAAGWTDAELQKHGVTLRDPDFLPNPFCWGTRKEAWLTFENRDGDFFTGLGNTLHETGHLLYLLSLNRLPPEIRDTPLGQVNGYGVHEVASMFFEQCAGDRKFWELVAPLVQKHFGVAGPEWSADNLCALMNRASFTETEWGASEVSLMPNMYFRVMAEREIMDGRMEVPDLPAFWADTMTDLTGVRHDPDEFFVDESHWLDRQTGYFPAYWIGALCGSRLHQMVDRDTADKAATLSDYMREHVRVADARIFRHAALDRPLDMIAHEMGGRPEDFLRTHLERIVKNYGAPRTGAVIARLLPDAPDLPSGTTPQP